MANLEREWLERLNHVKSATLSSKKKELLKSFLGSGSLVSTEVNLKIKRKKDETKKARVEYIFSLKKGKCKLWMIRNFELIE